MAKRVVKAVIREGNGQGGVDEYVSWSNGTVTSDCMWVVLSGVLKPHQRKSSLTFCWPIGVTGIWEI